jgi:hypothetical protein
MRDSCGPPSQLLPPSNPLALQGSATCVGLESRLVGQGSASSQAAAAQQAQRHEAGADAVYEVVWQVGAVLLWIASCHTEACLLP